MGITRQQESENWTIDAQQNESVTYVVRIDGPTHLYI